MNEKSHILDASALLALMLGEPDAESVQAVLPTARISTVNLSEVIAKLIERGAPDAVIADSIAELDLDVRDFDQDQAVRAGALRTATREAGLSLGDRACLAAAAATSSIAITTDRAWRDLAIGVDIEVARP